MYLLHFIFNCTCVFNCIVYNTICINIVMFYLHVNLFYILTD